MVGCRSWYLYEIFGFLSNLNSDDIVQYCMSSWPYHQRIIFLSCSSTSSKWLLAWLSIFGLKIRQEKQCCPKPQACFSSADYLYQLIDHFCTHTNPWHESDVKCYLPVSGIMRFWWFLLTRMMLYLPLVSLSSCLVFLFSDYMSIEEYFEEDEEPPLLLCSCLSDCEYAH